MSTNGPRRENPAIRQSSEKGDPQASQPSALEADDDDFDRHTYLVESFINRKEIKKPIRKLPSLLRSSFSLVWTVGRWDFLFAAFLQLTSGMGATVQLLAGKDILTGVLSAEAADKSLRGLAVPLVIFVVTTALVKVIGAVQAERSRLVSELVQRRAMDQIIDVASTIDLEAFETATFYNRLQRAEIDGQARPYNMVSGAVGLIGGAFGLIGIGAALVSMEPLLLLFLIAYVPLWLVQKRLSKDSYDFLIKWVESNRHRSYLRSVLTKREAAKEVRAFDLAGLIRGRYDRLFDEYLVDLRRRLRSRLTLSVVGTIANTALTAMTVAFLLYLWRANLVKLPEAGAALAGLQMLGGRLEAFIRGINTLYENALFLEDFQSFLELKTGETTFRGPAAPFTRLDVEEVRFFYPGTNSPALDGVSLHIDEGEIIALVGENGSGKTTLAKILAHLYRPHEGRILWDGTETGDMDRVELRRNIALIFQDFEKYQLPARENIGVGRSEKFDDFDSIRAASQRVNAEIFIEKLPNSYDTILSKEYKGGRDLSVGQWQRIALARAFFRDAPFIILDEPTAALDARAEHDLFESIRTMSAGRTVLLISHRFSSVRSADRIYVLDKGRIVEQGSHQELMRQDGIYSELFTLQASQYIDTPQPVPGRDLL